MSVKRKTDQEFITQWEATLHRAYEERKHKAHKDTPDPYVLPAEVYGAQEEDLDPAPSQLSSTWNTTGSFTPSQPEYATVYSRPSAYHCCACDAQMWRCSVPKKSVGVYVCQNPLCDWHGVMIEIPYALSEGTVVGNVGDVVGYNTPAVNARGPRS